MKVGLFYSYGPHFLKAIHFLVEQFPEDNIILFIPEDFPSYYFEKLPVSIVPLPWSGQHIPLLKGIKIFLNIIKIIRSQRLDQFTVLFESPRQIMLCKLSGAKHSFVYSIHKEFKPISQGFFQSLTRILIARFKGLCLYSYILLHVSLCKQQKKKHYHS
ncbi:MAG: hypothetical protein ACP5UA_06430 [Candidatus Hydrogenedens sp.]